MKYLVKFFEFNETDFSEEDTITPIESEAISVVEGRLKEIYDKLGFVLSKEPKFDEITLPEGKKLVKYHGYKLDCNFNKNKTSLLNLMCLYTSMSNDNKVTEEDIKNPIKYDAYIYPMTRNGSYLDTLRTYLSKYDTRKKKPEVEKKNWNFFHEENPEKIFHIMNNFVFQNIEDCIDELHIQFNGTTSSPNLIECIKQYIKLNDNINNTDILIPDLMIDEIKKSINNFDSYELWNQIQLHNKPLYNKLKSKETDDAAEMSGMGFED